MDSGASEGGLMGALFRRRQQGHTETHIETTDLIYQSMFTDTGAGAILTQFAPPLRVGTLPSPPQNGNQLTSHLAVARAGEDVLRAVYWFRKGRQADDVTAIRKALRVAITFCQERGLNEDLQQLEYYQETLDEWEKKRSDPNQMPLEDKLTQLALADSPSPEVSKQVSEGHQYAFSSSRRPYRRFQSPARTPEAQRPSSLVPPPALTFPPPPPIPQAPVLWPTMPSAPARPEKLNKLQNYTGEQNIEGFLRLFEIYAKEKRLTTEGKFIELCAHLDEDPLSMIQNDPNVNSYAEAVQLLKETYAHLAQRHFHELEVYKRGTLSIAEYNRGFEKLKNKAKPLLNPYLEIQLYTRGIEPTGLRDKIEVNNPSTLRSAMDLAQKLESRFLQNRTGPPNAANPTRGAVGRGLCPKCNKYHNLDGPCQSIRTDFRNPPSRPQQPRDQRDRPRVNMGADQQESQPEALEQDPEVGINFGEEENPDMYSEVAPGQGFL